MLLLPPTHLDGLGGLSKEDRMAKRSETELLLVRSGRTDWEDQGRLQGHADLPLAESGRAALVANLNHLLGAVSGLSLTTVVTAPDEASRETARLLAERTGAKVRVNENLKALSLGLWEGLPDEQLTERYARSYKAWYEDPASANPPEGEPFVVGQVRILTALARVLEKAAGPIGIVLRPLEYGLVRAVIAGEPTSKLWRLVEDGPLTELVTVDPASIRGVLDQLKAKA